MKLTAERDTLLDGLTTIQGAVSSKNTLPILQNILLEAEDDELTMTATDLEISVQTHQPVALDEAGSCTLPAQKFKQLLQELPSGDTEINLILEENQVDLTVEETQSNFQLPTLPVDDFPSLPDVEEGFQVELEGARLDYLLDKSNFAASTDTTRNYLRGIYFDLSHDELTVVATDAHRLALHRVELTDYEAGDRSLLIPINATKQLVRILPDEGMVRLVSDENLVRFELEGATLTSRLIDEEFPNYQQVIPDEYEHRAEVDRDRFLQAVRRVSLLADEQTRRLLLTLNSDQLTLEAESGEAGGGVETLPVDYTGDEQQIAFNGDYLADVLNHIEDESAYFDLISSESPGTFRPMDDEDYLYIIMPLRLR